MKEYTQNEITIRIGNPDEPLADCTLQVPFPLKWSDLLDEQLDESTLSILRAKTEIFQPFVMVSVNAHNAESTDEVTKTYYVASDKADEIPPGSERYNHELYLIEETKWLERFVIPSAGFINALGRTYVE